MRQIDADFAKERIKKSDLTNREKIALILTLEDIPTLASPPNALLTLEELREMDGEPVWVEFPKCKEASGWMLISASRNCVYNGFLGGCDFENCGKTWLAYRRKPETMKGRIGEQNGI